MADDTLSVAPVPAVETPAVGTPAVKDVERFVLIILAAEYGILLIK